MRFAVWAWQQGVRVPSLKGRETTATAAETLAERVYAEGTADKVAVFDGETGEWLLSLPTMEE